MRTDKELYKIFQAEQRLTHKGKKEIEIMLVGELPDLQDTQSGKDLIRIGEERGLEKGLEKGREKGREEGREEGEEKGLEKAILLFLTTRHGSVPASLEEKIRALAIDEAERLLAYLYQPQAPTLEDVDGWLAGRHA